MSLRRVLFDFLARVHSGILQSAVGKKKTCKTEHERLRTFFRLSRERVPLYARGTHCSSKTQDKQTYTNVKVHSLYL